MAKNVRFELNRKGVAELMRSGAMQDMLKDYARTVQGRAGDGYEITTHIGKTRANCSVYAATDKARRDTYNHNTLLKALGGGEG